MNDEPLDEPMWVTASPEKGVECFGERLGEFGDTEQILDDALIAMADRKGIPASRLYWKKNVRAGNGASYELQDLAGPIQRRRHWPSPG